jgi:hypothetical protein
MTLVAWVFWLQAESCESCHGEALSDFSSSVHHRRGVECQACHGTDALDSERTAQGQSPHVRQSTFLGKPKNIVEFCSRCHAADAESFRSGKHAGVMDCLACHSHHSTSPAEFAEISRACSRCHPAERIESIRVPLDSSRAQVKASSSKEAAVILESMRSSQHGLHVTGLRTDAERIRKLLNVSPLPLDVVGFVGLLLSAAGLSAAWIRRGGRR